MESKVVRNSISVVLITVMVMSIFSISTAIQREAAHAATTDAVASKNKVKFGVVKYGKTNKIYPQGHRYNTVYKNYKKHADLSRQGIYDLSMFTWNETYYEPVSMTISKGNYTYPTIYFNHYDNQMYEKPYMTMYGDNPAGKYKMKTVFRQCIVNQATNPITLIASSYTVTKTNTFYVRSKVKLSYDKNKATLKKANRTKYKKPGKKYGKLPTPKAKKGYKFAGWYTKKSGGKKITSSTKVPTKNTIKLYARYYRR